MNRTWEQLRREAADPTTSAGRLAQLAVDHRQLWDLIVANPSCDAAYRDWIIAQRPDLRAADSAAPTADGPGEYGYALGGYAAGYPTSGAPAPSADGAPADRTWTVGAAAAGAPAVGGSTIGAPIVGASVGGTPAPGASTAAVPVAAEPSRAVGRRPKRVVVPVLVTLMLLVTVGAGVAWWVLDSGRTGSTVAGSEADPPRRSDAVGEPTDESTPTDAGSSTATDDAATDGPTTDSATTDSASADPVVPDDGWSGSAIPVGDVSVDGLEVRVPSLAEGDYLLLSSPSQNISCQIGRDVFGCSIAEREWEDACPEHALASFVSVGGGSATTDCERSFLGRAGDDAYTLEYGQVLITDNVSCFSDTTGLSCGRLDSDAWMMLSRARYSLQ
ncbi:variant leucine-rich repeat-containing protein [Brachybacterium sp. DNPG3]